MLSVCALATGSLVAVCFVATKLGANDLGVDNKGGGAPFLTVNGCALVVETVGKLSLFATVTLFLEALSGKLPSRGMSNVFGMTVRCAPSLMAKTTSAKGLETGFVVVIKTCPLVAEVG